MKQIIQMEDNIVKDGFPLSYNFYMHVQARKFCPRKQNRDKVRCVALKCDVEFGATLTFTCNLSCVASLLFANINFTQARM